MNERLMNIYTPTKADLAKLKGWVDRYNNLLYIIGQTDNSKKRELFSLNSQLIHAEKNIRRLVKNIENRFKNTLILEATYETLEDSKGVTGRYRQKFTDVTANDFKEYVKLNNIVNPKVHIRILELKEIQDTLEKLPL